MKISAGTLAATLALAVLLDSRLLWAADGVAVAADSTPLSVRRALTNPAARDQDDLCFFVRADDPRGNAVVVSDKSANALFVYGLSGELRQQISLRQPGNIDLRSDVELGGRRQHLVVVNERGGECLAVFRVDPAEGRLERIDDSSIATGENYGGTLYHDQRTGRLYFLSTSKTQGVTLFELLADDNSQVRGRRVRHWDLNMCEGAVADDLQGQMYVCVEAEGIYRLSADPHVDAPPECVIRVGEHGFVGDAEGICLLSRDAGHNYLIVSDQGASCFRVYRAAAPYEFLGALTVADVHHTDGLDVTTAGISRELPAGVFGCHSDQHDGRTLPLVDAAELFKLLDQWEAE